MVPLDVRASEKPLPAATFVTLGRPVRSIGLVWTVPGVPSCPESARPQPHTLPFAVAAIVWSSPPPIEMTWAGPGMGCGLDAPPALPRCEFELSPQPHACPEASTAKPVRFPDQIPVAVERPVLPFTMLGDGTEALM